MGGVHGCLLAFADIDGPAGIRVVIDEAGGGIIWLLVIGEHTCQGNRLAVGRDAHPGEDEVTVLGGAGPILRQRLVVEDTEAQSGHGVEIGKRGEFVGLPGRSGLVDQERMVVEDPERGAGGGLVGFVPDRMPVDRLEWVLFPRRGRGAGGIPENLVFLNLDGGPCSVGILRVVEKGEELVVIALGDGIEFVSVTLGATHGESQPDRPRGVDPVDHGLDPELFAVRAAFLVDEGVAVEGGGDPLRLGGVGKQIARELFDRELIEGEVVVEGLDDPVAERPHVTVAVDGVSVGVGVAGLVEPVPAPALAVVRGRQQAVDESLDARGSILAACRLEGPEFLHPGEEAG